MGRIELHKIYPGHRLNRVIFHRNTMPTYTTRSARSSFAFILALLLLTSFAPRGDIATARDAPSVGDTPELHQALLDLTNVWTVMCVAAHPDDEDGATLTVLRRKYGVHTVTLFSTYGEGGQNAIGSELYEELGAIRAQETLKAAEIQGSEPHFLGLKDFGFSKSAEEAFHIWGHDEALRRMVLQIRTLQPDVVITNHDMTGGHGHHQATGRLVVEAFDAAADPKRFPEQLKTASLWQVKRLFVRTSSNTAEDKPADVSDSRTSPVITIDRNEIDPVRGTSYAEQALRALQQHASQGPWPQTLPKEGWPAIRYRLVRKAKDAEPIPSNATTFLDGMTLSKSLQKQLSALRLDGRPLAEFAGSRERVFDTLIAASRKVLFGETPSAGDYIKASRLLERYNTARALASGVSLTISKKSDGIVPQANAEFTVTVANKGTKEVQLRSGWIGRKGGSLDEGVRIDFPKRLAPNSSISQKAVIMIPAGVRMTVPHHVHLYDGLWSGEEIQAGLSVTVDGNAFALFTVTRPDVVPAIEIASLTPSPYVLTPGNLDQTLTFKVRLRNNRDRPFRGQFGIASPTDHGAEVGALIELAPNETREFTIRSNVIPADTPDERRMPRNDFGPIIISVGSWEGSKVISEQEVRVIYSGARVALNLRVGYVRSFDDSLRNALFSLGVESQELSVDDIRTGDLQKFDTIIVDNRGYQAHPELVAANTRLMDFTKNGGTLIVFYHKTDEWNEDPEKGRPSLAPYPIALGNERVTDENAAVTFTEPLHPLLNTPNKIVPDDFRDWIQERGLYYPKSWDAHYQTLFSMSDAGEEPLRGGLLVADYGKGYYIYTSLVWYRQLRAGVPGGYRMFANMISYKH